MGVSYPIAITAGITGNRYWNDHRCVNVALVPCRLEAATTERSTTTAIIVAPVAPGWLCPGTDGVPGSHRRTCFGPAPGRTRRYCAFSRGSSMAPYILCIPLYACVAILSPPVIVLACTGYCDIDRNGNRTAGGCLGSRRYSMEYKRMWAMIIFVAALVVLYGSFILVYWRYHPPSISQFLGTIAGIVGGLFVCRYF